MLVKSLRDLATILNGEWITPPVRDWTPEIIVSKTTSKIGVVPENSIVILNNVGDDQELLKNFVDGEANCCFVVDNSNSIEHPSAIVLRVDSVEDVREKIAKHTRENFLGKIVAITGSVGKTTTKNMLYDILSTKCHAYVSPKSYNTNKMLIKQLVTLSEEDYAIFELSRAASAPGSLLTKPDIAILTAVGEAHMDRVASLEEVAKLKARIFQGLSDHGTAIINRDIPYFDAVKSIAKKYTQKIITYGESDSDVTLKSYDINSKVVEVNAFGQLLSYKLGADGKYNAVNSLAVIATLHSLGLAIEDFIGFFDSINPAEGRGSHHKIVAKSGEVTLINDAFNANPLSMSSSLDMFASLNCNGRKILCLGDMLELGEGADQYHANLIDSVLAVNADKIFLVGRHMTKLWERLPDNLKGAHLMSSEQLSPTLLEALIDSDCVLFKSSNGTGLSKVCEKLISDFSQSNNRYKLIIKGRRVQGVGYRRWLKKESSDLGLSGWVRNRLDGTIECVVSGYKPYVEAILSRCIDGPDNAEVEHVVISKYVKIIRPGFKIMKTR